MRKSFKVGDVVKYKFIVSMSTGPKPFKVVYKEWVGIVVEKLEYDSIRIIWGVRNNKFSVARSVFSFRLAQRELELL